MFKQILLSLIVLNTFAGPLEDQLFSVIISRQGVQAVTKAINAGADVNAKTKYNCSVLMTHLDDYLYDEDSKEVLKLLIAAGADVNASDFNYGSALRRVICSYNVIENGSYDINPESNSKIVWLETIKLLIAAGADVKAKINGYTILNCAMHTNIEIVKLLISAGADINSGRLFCSLAGGFNEKLFSMVMFLIDSGVNINERDDSGKTALLKALKNDNVNMSSLFITVGADVNAKDDDGKNAFFYLDTHTNDTHTYPTHHNDIVRDDTVRAKLRLLINSGANINAKDNNGWTALMFYSKKGCTVIVEELIKAGADVNVKEIYYNWTALRYAAFFGYTKIINLLRAAGAKE